MRFPSFTFHAHPALAFALVCLCSLLFVELVVAGDSAACSSCKSIVPFAVSDPALCEATCSTSWSERLGRSCSELCIHLRRYIEQKHASPCLSLGVCSPWSRADDESLERLKADLEGALAPLRGEVSSLRSQIEILHSELERRKSREAQLDGELRRLTLEVAALGSRGTEPSCAEPTTPASAPAPAPVVEYAPSPYPVPAPIVVPVKEAVPAEEAVVEQRYFPSILGSHFTIIVASAGLWIVAAFTGNSFFAMMEQRAFSNIETMDVELQRVTFFQNAFDLVRSLILLAMAAVRSHAALVWLVLCLGIDRYSTSFSAMESLISQDEQIFATGIGSTMAILIGLTLGHHLGQLLDHCKAVGFLFMSMIKSMSKKDGARANGDDSSPWQVLSRSNILSEATSCVLHLSVVFFMLFSSTAASTLVSAALFGLELSPFLLRLAIVASENTFKPFSLPLSRQNLSLLLSFVRLLSWSNVLTSYAALPDASAVWVSCIRGVLVFRIALDLWSALRLSRFFVAKGG